MTPKQLEMEMQARQALHVAKESMDMYLEVARFTAAVRREYFNALVKEGFTPEQALWLTSSYTMLGAFPGGGTGTEGGDKQ